MTFYLLSSASGVWHCDCLKVDQGADGETFHNTGSRGRKRQVSGIQSTESQPQVQVEAAEVSGAAVIVKKDVTFCLLSQLLPGWGRELAQSWPTHAGCRSPVHMCCVYSIGELKSFLYGGMIFSLLFAVKLKFMFLHWGMCSFTRRWVLDYKGNMAHADMYELGRMRLSSCCGHDKLVSTKSRRLAQLLCLSCSWNTLRWNFLDVSQCQESFLDWHGTVMDFYTFSPILSLWCFRKCFWKVPIGYIQPPETSRYLWTCKWKLRQVFNIHITNQCFVEEALLFLALFSRPDGIPSRLVFDGIASCSKKNDWQ